MIIKFGEGDFYLQVMELTVLGAPYMYILYSNVLHVKIGPNRVLFWKIGFAKDPPTACWLMVVTHMLIFLGYFLSTIMTIDFLSSFHVGKFVMTRVGCYCHVLT